MEITSEAFSDGEAIPEKYTCDGENINPPLTIDDIPGEAETLALIVDDPDAATDPDGPGKVFDHWVVFNIPPEKQIPEDTVPHDSIEGVNGAGKRGWTGPCPPTGEHTYRFRLYALDTSLDLAQGSTKDEVLSAMEGHVVADAGLDATYES